MQLKDGARCEKVELQLQVQHTLMLLSITSVSQVRFYHLLLPRALMATWEVVEKGDPSLTSSGAEWTAPPLTLPVTSGIRPWARPTVRKKFILVPEDARGPVWPARPQGFLWALDCVYALMKENKAFTVLLSAEMRLSSWKARTIWRTVVIF